MNLLAPSRYGVDRFIEINGWMLHYVETGSGAPLLMIPGSFSTYRTWDRLVPLLCDCCRLLPLDYLGTGDSDKPSRGFHYTIEEQTDVLARMIDMLGLAPANVIGSSYGGVIAFSLGYRYPDLIGKIISIEGSLVMPKSLPGDGPLALLRYPLVGDLFIGLARTRMLKNLFMRLVSGSWYPQMSLGDRQEMLAQLSFNARSATRHAWHAINISVQTSRDMEAEAKSLRAPALYIYGTASEFMPMIQLNLGFIAAHLPNVQVAAIQDGIHDTELQKPEEVARLVRAFLM